MNRKAFPAFILIFLAIFALFFAFKNRATPPAVSRDTLKVSASFYPLAFLAEQIGGEKVSVFTVTPAGAEPHDYEPSAQDIAKISDSKVLLLNGMNMEPWRNDIKRNLGPETAVITASEQLQAKNNDPHFWLDPILFKQMASRVEQSFSKADPKNTDLYSANLNALYSKIDALDSEYRQSLNGCIKKYFVTSHSAFGYLAQEYGLKQVSIAGLSPDAEPSPKQLSGIADFAKKNGVDYIFFESLASPRLSDTIAVEIDAKTLVLNPIEGLTPEEISSGKNYFTEMRANLNNLKIALQCR